MTTHHTPTPWATAARPRANVIKDAGDNVIARTEMLPEQWTTQAEALAEASANAAFIVEAVNSHAANVARIAELEAALRGLEDVGALNSDTAASFYSAEGAAKRAARDVLKGGQP